MLKNFRDKVALSGMTVLFIGVSLLVFTFVSAYSFLSQSLNIIGSADLARTFGDSLAPLIATCIRLMYLGVMGWVASLMTIRGVTIITHSPEAVPMMPQQQPIAEQKPKPQKTKDEKAKGEKTKEQKQAAEPQELDVVAIPPEPIAEPQPSNS
jgi:hypothetical protein